MPAKKSTRTAAAKSAASSSAKSSVKRRSRLVKGSQKATSGVPGSEQDPRRRLGNFATAGEHARVGGRTTGIVGQSKKRFRTDSRSRS